MDFGKSVLGIIAQLGNEVMELKAENKELRSKNAVAIKDEEIIISLEDKVRELKVELSQFKVDYNHDAKVCEDYDDGLIAECNDLKAEVESLKYIKALKDDYTDDLKQEIKELKAEVESLQDQLKDAVNDYEELLNSDGVK